MKLNEQTRQDYLDRHLPYRINSLLSYDLIIHRRKQKNHTKCYEDGLVLEPAFEISIIFGRALLNFLGITYDWKTSKLKRHSPKEDDISIIDIYPGSDFCPLDEELITQNHDSLCTIIKLSNKSVAHLTSTESTPNELQQLQTARQTIYKLILKYVPDINKIGKGEGIERKIGIWWYEQVEQ